MTNDQRDYDLQGGNMCSFYCLYLAGSNCAEDVDDAVGLLLALLGVFLAEQLAAANGTKADIC